MCPHTHEEDVSILYFFFANYMYGNGLVEFVVVLGVLGCFNGPHDGYANRSKFANEFASR